MKSTEDKAQRLLRVDMHEYFLSKIDEAMKKENYIEASWLIYSCFENRYFRTIQKYKHMCKYCRKKGRCNPGPKNDLSITTKVKCVQRLYNSGVPSIVNAFEGDIFDKSIKWINERNDLMHELLALETYQSSEELFKSSAEDGNSLLTQTYDYCTKFRKLFYDDDYCFVFPEDAMERCPCKPQKNKET